MKILQNLIEEKKTEPTEGQAQTGESSGYVSNLTAKVVDNL